MKAPFEPFGTAILLRKRENERRSKLILPDTSEKDFVWCDVVAVGPGNLTSDGTRVPCQFVVGDVVMLYEGDAYSIELYGVAYLFCDQTKIVGRKLQTPFDASMN